MLRLCARSFLIAQCFHTYCEEKVAYASKTSLSRRTLQTRDTRAITVNGAIRLRAKPLEKAVTNMSDPQ